MGLTLNTFLAPTDFEAAQYGVLAELKKYQNAFNQTCLYPPLSELADCYGVLRDLLKKSTAQRAQLRKEVADLDLKHRELLFKLVDAPAKELEQVWALMAWALPLMRGILDEALKILHFVSDHVTIVEVGILPMYREEGYWLVPHVQEHEVRVLRYTATLYTSADERFRTLKTVQVAVIDQQYVMHTFESIKLSLIKTHRDLPNPATYATEVDVDMGFPFVETVLPVAKRQLMDTLFAQTKN